MRKLSDIGQLFLDSTVWIYTESPGPREIKERFAPREDIFESLVSIQDTAAKILAFRRFSVNSLYYFERIEDELAHLALAHFYFGRPGGFPVTGHLTSTKEFFQNFQRIYPENCWHYSKDRNSEVVILRSHLGNLFEVTMNGLISYADYFELQQSFPEIVKVFPKDRFWCEDSLRLGKATLSTFTYRLVAGLSSSDPDPAREVLASIPLAGQKAIFESANKYQHKILSKSLTNSSSIKVLL